MNERVDSYDRNAPTPEVGSRWIWEPDKPHAFERIAVGEVLWNGEEWWVRTDGEAGKFWNSLSRFWEAVVADPADLMFDRWLHPFGDSVDEER